MTSNLNNNNNNNNNNNIKINNSDMVSNNRLFTEFYTSFETDKITDTEIIGTDTSLIDIHFGILKLHAVPANITNNDIEFVFVVDHSRSMYDKCSDGKTKMEHIIHTLKNMFLYFHKISSDNLYFTIFIFDERFDSIMERKQICKNEDIDLIFALIDNIEPRGSTNIECALNKTCEYIQSVKKKYPNCTFNNIFMTDGQATSGSKNNILLKNILIVESTNINNYFIGFGLDHDACLLNYISNSKNSSYYFIDAIEKAGLVYGEILHDILYRLLSDVQIIVENGSIYDYKNNIWVKNLYIGNINGESNKTYHLLSYSPNDCNVIINCKYEKEENNIIVNKSILDNLNHIKFIYRQKTLQLLYEINDYSNKSSEMKNHLKKNILALFNEIKNYITNNTNTNNTNTNTNIVEDNIFLNNLCDDISISYRTMDSKYGAMYSYARQTSQGTQRCYTVTQTPDYLDFDWGINTLRQPRLNRNRYNHFDGSYNINDVFIRLPNDRDNDNDNDNNDNDRDDQDILVHHMNDFDESPYLTPTASQLMREISAFDTLSMSYNSKFNCMDDFEKTQSY
jgi:hypothetical protein